MSDMTLLLVQILGPVFGLLGLGFLINSKFYFKVYRDLEKETFAVMAVTMAMIALGIVFVTNHWLWGSLPEVLVSIIGLGFLIKGAFLALLPKTLEEILDKLLSPTIFTVGGFIWLIGGIYFTWVGFIG